MNFKQQMQEKAYEAYPLYYDDGALITPHIGRRLGHAVGSRAALSSDLVKGLVEADEKALSAINEV